MFRLIKKDLIIGGLFLAVTALVISVLTLMAVVTMLDKFESLVPGFYFPFVTILCVCASFLFTLIDEASGADALFASLPLSKWKIVGARYLSSSLMILCSFALIAFVSHAVQIILQKKDPILKMMLSIEGMAGMVLFLLLFLAFYFPFIFRFGLAKGAGIGLIAQLCLFSIVPAGRFIVDALSGVVSFDLTIFVKLFEAVRSWVTGMSDAKTFVFMIAVLVTAAILSLALSIRFFKHKDI